MATCGMIVISQNVVIPEHEIVMTAIRAQGAGGQHVNKTSTAIHLRFNIAESSLPEHYKTELLKHRHHLITPGGVIVIKSQIHRSQEMNREDAIEKLISLIKTLMVVAKARKPTKPTRASKERRLTAKSQKSMTKHRRGKVRHGME